MAEFDGTTKDPNDGLHTHAIGFANGHTHGGHIYDDAEVLRRLDRIEELLLELVPHRSPGLRATSAEGE